MIGVWYSLIIEYLAVKIYAYSLKRISESLDRLKRRQNASENAVC